MPNILIAFSISFLIGYLLTRLIFARDYYRVNSFDLYMHLTLALPFGLGASALILFYSLLFTGRAIGPVFIAAHLFVLIFLLYFNNRRQPFRQDFKAFSHKPVSIKWAIIIGVMLAYVFFHILPFFIKYPYGLWDALTCWNLRAKFIFLSDNWLRAFSPTLSAVDYPILLPLNVVWGWVFIGRDSVVSPITLAIIYTFSTILFTFTAIARYFGPKKALLVSLFLISVTSFLKITVTQFADIALSCYNTIGVICYLIALRERRADYMLLGGISLGLAAFTKNEGLLIFLIANLVFYFSFAWKNKEFRKMLLRSVEGALLSLAAVMIIKQISYSPEKMFMTEGMSPQLFFTKLKIFLLFFPANVFIANLWSLFWYVVVVFFAFFYKKIFQGSRSIISLTAVLVFSGYFVVYLFKLEPPVQNLSYSYQRFLGHFLPLLCFLIADTIFEADKDRIKGKF